MVLCTFTMLKCLVEISKNDVDKKKQKTKNKKQKKIK